MNAPMDESCLIVLLDRSRSMQALLTSDDPDPVTAALREVLEMLPDLDVPCTVTVRGYGTDRLARPQVISANLGAAPRADGFVTAGDLPGAETVINWNDLDPIGGTPTAATFENCYAWVQPWVEQHPQATPPVVLHITDGQPRDGSPLRAAGQLQSLATQKGHLQLMNFVLGDEQDEGVMFPAEAGFADDTDRREQARLFFELSSPLSDTARELAGMAFSGQPEPGARALVFRSDPEQLLTFVDFAASVISES